jgi:cytoskeleton protein RodZ
VSTGPTDSSPQSPPTLGSALRAAREAAGQSVEQVSADTRIRATLVRDLEADHFASSGGLVYARGHIKSIASSLRVDPAPLLALFDQAQDTAPDPLTGPDQLPRAVTSFGGSDFVASAAASLRPERRTPRWGIAVAGAAVVLGGLIAVGALNNGSPTGQTNAGEASPTAASPTPTRAAPSPQPSELTASKPPVTGAQLRLRLIGGESWVSVSNAASTVLFEGLLHAGDFKDFTDPTRLKVVVGNAQPVNLNCGGRDSGPAGGPGAVRRFECTATGLKAL